MLGDIRVYDVFNTSIGQVAILVFFVDTRPRIGMRLVDEGNSKWVISGIGWDRISEFGNPVFSEFPEAKSIWDCSLRTMEDGTIIEKNTLLSILEDE
jgi:hypothetical protein